MEKIGVGSVEELHSTLKAFGPDCLFRGQTASYGEPDKPSILTSFDRKGCVPSEMLKWARYASNVLEAFVDERGRSRDFQQALLQHYGWRSFYIDCTANPAVAAWFASHQYSEHFSIDMSEDYEERPVWLRKRQAGYTFESDEGHIYVLDRQACATVGLTDLDVLAVEGYRPRTRAQAAWLLGPLRNSPLGVDCIRAHIVGSREVFRDFAAECDLTETDQLFPPPTEDPILNALLSLPWREIVIPGEDDFPIPAFRRALDLPEYHDSFVKIAWPRTAFFRGACVADTLQSIEGDPIGGIVIKVPDVVLFGSADRSTPLRFPAVEAHLSESGSIAFEADELIQHVQMGHTTLYQKGIGVIPHATDLFELCELMVEHPGMDLTRAGFNHGWFYRRHGDGLWRREQHPDQCPCEGDEAHLRHLSSLHIAEAYLQAPDEF